ncbi:MAG: hypothetical protein FWD71_00750 [Oscillospiraceae bacterium]|nr:hypothetical protein [Oscillospiraceae bacterium]
MNKKINKKPSMFILTFIACITVFSFAFSTVSSVAAYAYTSPTPGGISNSATTRGLIDNRTGGGSLYDNYRTLSGVPTNYNNYRSGGVYTPPGNNFAANSANYGTTVNPANNLNNNYGGYRGFTGTTGTIGLNDTMYRSNMNATNSYTNMNIPNINNYPHNPSNLGTAVNTDYYARGAYNMYRSNNNYNNSLGMPYGYNNTNTPGMYNYSGSLNNANTANNNINNATAMNQNQGITPTRNNNTAVNNNNMFGRNNNTMMNNTAGGNMNSTFRSGTTANNVNRNTTAAQTPAANRGSMMTSTPAATNRANSAAAAGHSRTTTFRSAKVNSINPTTQAATSKATTTKSTMKAAPATAANTNTATKANPSKTHTTRANAAATHNKAITTRNHTAVQQHATGSTARHGYRTNANADTGSKVTNNYVYNYYNSASDGNAYRSGRNNAVNSSSNMNNDMHSTRYAFKNNMAGQDNSYGHNTRNSISNRTGRNNVVNSANNMTGYNNNNYGRNYRYNDNNSMYSRNDNYANYRTGSNYQTGNYRANNHGTAGTAGAYGNTFRSATPSATANNNINQVAPANRTTKMTNAPATRNVVNNNRTAATRYRDTVTENRNATITFVILLVAIAALLALAIYALMRPRHDRISDNDSAQRRR